MWLLCFVLISSVSCHDRLYASDTSTGSMSSVPSNVRTGSMTSAHSNVGTGSMTSAPSNVRTGSMTSASSSHNLAGCPKLAENCNFDCLDIGHNGCIECTCTKDLQGNGNALTSAHSDLNSNGCPSFPSNCGPSCTSLDSNGCPVCTCSTGAKNSTSISQAAATSSMTSSNLNGCPPFSTGCSAECVKLDTNGCPVYTTSMTSPNHVGQGSSGNLNGCPAFSLKCPPQCTTTDYEGCPICNCIDSLTSTECQPMVAQCQVECLQIDDAGCVSCTEECNELISKEIITTTAAPVMTTGTEGKSGTGSLSVSCQTFDGVHCNPTCLNWDINGCITCDCNTGGSKATATTPSPALLTGGDAGTGNGSSSTGNNNGCQVFDTQCDPRCVKLDSLGCLTCSCETIKSTQIPLVPGSVSYMTTFAPNVNVTGTSFMGSNSGTSNTNGCPPFDVTCTAGCAVLDAVGCLSCNCGTNNATTGSGSGTSNGGGNAAGCPTFDTGCPTQCVVMNSFGCVACSCSGATNTSTPPSPTVNTGCPRVEVLSCQPSCLSVDLRGCVQCSCPATTTVPANANANTPESIQQSTTGQPTEQTPTTSPATPLLNKSSTKAFLTTPPVTQTSTDASFTTLPVAQTPSAVPAAITHTNPTSTTYITQTCPIFDETCPHKCITIDDGGCLRCTCTVSPEGTTTKATTIIPSTHAQQTTPTTVRMCPPIRCVYPCDAGVMLGTDHCPICKCHSTTTLPIVV